MTFIADLHVHSRFSRATSRTLDPENLAMWAMKKGITVVGTGDFTHPDWMAELREKLMEAEEGLYRLRPEFQSNIDPRVPGKCSGDARFLLSGEISCIYKKNGATRKLHHLILMKDFESVERLNDRLARIGNIVSDGRPILGLDSRNLLEIVLETSDEAFFIPAHIWTPWFSLFGSKSGFESLEECFEDLSGHIHALETGLSSDPPMNRLLSSLDPYILVSNSDAHSPSKLGREANLFDTDLNYKSMIGAMTHGNGFKGTIEFYPEEGKYHLDGHRKCHARLYPHETEESNGICPVCGRPVTVGVLHRIHHLSDRESPRLSKPFFSLIPLCEILSELLETGPATKKVLTFYEQLLATLGPELTILLDSPLDEIEKKGGPLLSEAVSRMRQGKVVRQEGYDGEYGIIKLFDASEKEAFFGQTALFERPEAATSPLSQPIHVKPEKLRGAKPKKIKAPQRDIPSDPILDPLNPEQREAVTSGPGSVLVEAGPGTGKTMTLANRIVYLIREGLAEPGQILALTFTRKAQVEMKQRIQELRAHIAGKGAPAGTDEPVMVTTFHGFCLHLIRQNEDLSHFPRGFKICPERDAQNIAEKCIEGSRFGKALLKKFLRNLPSLKESLLENSAPDAEEAELRSFLTTYHQKLRSLNMVDLDDLQSEALRLLRDNPDVAGRLSSQYPWIFVDEYQDTNEIQTRFLKALYDHPSGDAEPETRGGLFAIGDPDQAIYGFRGSDVNNFYRFTEDFPGAFKIGLSRNYRSTGPILKGAAELMGKEEPLRAHASGTDPIFLGTCRTSAEEAEMVVEQIERIMGGTSYFSLDSGRVASADDSMTMGFGDIGILFRLNAQGDLIAEALTRAGIPFSRSGEVPLIHRSPVDILWRFFQATENPDNNYYEDQYRAAMKAHNMEGAENLLASYRGTGPIAERIDQALNLHMLDSQNRDSLEAVRRFRVMAEDFGDRMGAFLDTLCLERGMDHTCLPGDRVALMSLHASKGLEWDIVFLTGCEDQLLPCTLFGERDLQEEKRLFYVGATRARKRLILSHSSHRTLNGRTIRMNPSPFLDLMGIRNLQPLDRHVWKPRKMQKQLELFKA